ncbi:CDP-alcohol phosphatidyltransferase family protein [Tenacibaculum jejuense]|uniref:CDP-alcohol phosphatidyltransferase n=1 Tax=Tenacibaculum jejuense TaxID=584609 RepID=A0A238U921_9FLAO|nr:CDP-alcohol phosphatidyltransferase family protein [Tenacibaculum jejuense]SNR15689.1 CDP-alcohol phosphatidyltransferase [Tenacibaculum jejuense]
MNIKKHIPNIITLGNLFCGTVAAILAVRGFFYETAIFVGIGIVLDFLDGFAARLLQVQGELGKQLDSLADMVTSGVVPGIVMLQFMVHSAYYREFGFSSWDSALDIGLGLDNLLSVELLGLLLTLFAGYRLAKFNIDTRQTDSFIGLPTPAMNLFVVSLPMIAGYTKSEFVLNIIHNQFFLIAVTLILSFLMISELPLFSLKFKSAKLKDNLLKYSFILTSVVLLILLKFLAIPLIIILYILLSVFNTVVMKQK